MKLVIPIELTEEEQRDLQYLFQDALWDFVRSRSGDYVEHRYPEFDENQKAVKRHQVKRRINLAGKLRSAAFQMRIEEGE